QTSLRPHPPPPRRRRLLLRRPHPRRRRTRLARRTQPRSHVRRRLALAVQQPQRLPLSLLCAGRTPFAPGRVLLRFGGGIGFVVGAPPRCEPGNHNPRPIQVPLRTRGGCSYGSGLGCGSVVGAPPTVRTGQTQIVAPCRTPFAPGAGAPTVRRWDWLCCRSTASVRTGRAQSTPHACPPSHPGRVLLRVGGGIGYVVGAPPRCERGRAQTLPTHSSVRHI